MVDGFSICFLQWRAGAENQVLLREEVYFTTLPLGALADELELRHQVCWGPE